MAESKKKSSKAKSKADASRNGKRSSSQKEKTRPSKASAANGSAKKAPPAKKIAQDKSVAKEVAPPPPLKKKPPSITITRPEVTRPPVVIPPPRPLEAPISAPSILLPKGGSSIGSLTPNMRWMYVGGATRYEVEWSADAHFGRGRSITLVATQTTITLDALNELKPATNYLWRVRGGNDAGWGPWSHPETFRSPEK